ncbi:hypothetical protein OHA04_45705 (plasmid) [Streptomyces sp. NBC_01590]|uniref:hypothetical protein n=1 Tax=Streptomyces sp. NBC_01590 TaxID=2975887 RepID=UPI002F919751
MTRELVGAAARYTTRTAKTTAQTPARGRQVAAWGFYRTPEVRSYANWIANAMSGALLYAGRRRPDGSIERAPDDHPAARLVASIAGGPDGQAQLLREHGRHLAVAGEGWTVIRPRESVGADWHVVSVLEMDSKGRGALEAKIDGETVKIPAHDPDAAPDPMAPAAIRVWDPSPEHHLEADSPVLASLEQLEELRLLSAAVRAITRSRLTGRGVILVPQGTRFPTTPGQSDAEDDLIDVFMTVAQTAIQDPESAAATVPIILEVPAETINGITHLTLESNFDELAIKLRQENITRFATAADIPAEFLLGMGDINHWGAWELTSEAIRLGIEPRLRVVTHAYTNHWLQPLLEDEDLPDAHEWLVLADTSPLRVRTNRSETALKVYELGAISAKALRRETGFDEADAPTATEQREQEHRNQDHKTEGEPLPVDETTTEPDTLPASAATTTTDGMLAAAADGLIWAALSAAGRKLERTPACPRSQRAQAREIEPAELHTLVAVDVMQVDQWKLLDGAWSRVPEIATRYSRDPECLAAVLDEYARALIAAGVSHTFEQTAGVLHAPCLAAAA